MNRSDISLSVVRVPAAALALLTASTRHPGSVSAPRGPAGLGTHRVPGATHWSLLGAGLVSRMPECLLLSNHTKATPELVLLLLEPALGGTELESSRYSVPLRSPLGTRCERSWAGATWAPVASRHEEAEAWGWAGGAALGLSFGSCPAGKGTGRSWRHPPGLAPALSASACVRSAAERRGKKLEAGSQRPATCAAWGAQGAVRRAACCSAQRCCCCGHGQAPPGAGRPSARLLSVNIHMGAQGEGRTV